MKYSIQIPTLLIFFITCFGTAYSQTEQFRFYLSGGTGVRFSYQYESETADLAEVPAIRSLDCDLAASAGFFVLNGLAVGLTSSMRFNATIEEDYGETRSVTRMLMPTLRYYIPAAKDWRPFVHIGAGKAALINTTDRQFSAPTVEKYTGPALQGGAGIAFFAFRHLSFDLGAVYTYANLPRKGPERTKFERTDLRGYIGISVFPGRSN